MKQVVTKALAAVAIGLGLLLSSGAGGSLAAQEARIANIIVEGNQRIEAETVLSYLTFSPGDVYDPQEADEALKRLYATGLFADVKIDREPPDVRVTVVENPIVILPDGFFAVSRPSFFQL